MPLDHNRTTFGPLSDHFGPLSDHNRTIFGPLSDHSLTISRHDPTKPVSLQYHSHPPPELWNDAVGSGHLSGVGSGLLLRQQSHKRLRGQLLWELHHVIVGCDDVFYDNEQPVISFLLFLHICWIESKPSKITLFFPPSVLYRCSVDTSLRHTKDIQCVTLSFSMILLLHRQSSSCVCACVSIAYRTGSEVKECRRRWCVSCSHGEQPHMPPPLLHLQSDPHICCTQLQIYIHKLCKRL